MQFFLWVNLIKHVINLFLPTFDFSTGAGSRTTAQKGSKRRGSSPRDEGCNEVNICAIFFIGSILSYISNLFLPTFDFSTDAGSQTTARERSKRRGSSPRDEGGH